jgi:predicted ATPase
MITNIKITSKFILWSRLLGGKRRKDVNIPLIPGVNVIASSNGSGKTTIMNAIKEKIFPPTNSLAELLGKTEERIAIDDESDGLNITIERKPDTPMKPYYFFSIKDMDARKMLGEVTPYDENAGYKMAIWHDRAAMSHGQATFELVRDIEEFSKNADVIFIDEPEIALDANKIGELADTLKRIGNDAQIVIISHHPLLILNKNFNVVELDGSKKYQKQALSNMMSVLQ